MPSSGMSAFGTTLSWNGTALAELLSIGGPRISIDKLDITNHSSTNGWREFVAGLKDGGEFSVGGNFKSSDASGQIALVTDMQAGTARTMILTGPTAAAFTWTATCLCTGWEQDYPHDGKLGFTATFQITGQPVLAVTASANLTSLTGIEENAGAALTFLPAFAAAKYSYNHTVNTASTWVKYTPTLAGATIKAYVNGTYVCDIASGAQSGTLSLGAAATITTVRLDVLETGKVAKSYTFYVYRA